MNVLKNATILVIDDDLISLLVIEEYLSHFCKQLIIKNDVETALALVIETQPDIILLDIVMQNMDGYEICRQLKEHEKTQHIPVIFLSSLREASDKVKGFDVGGVDYISKPFETEEMLARIQCCLKLHQQIHQKQKNSAANKAEKIKSYKLTNREVEIFSLYALGLQRNEIAEQLLITENTVKSHLKRILIKLQVKNRTQATEKAREIGLIVS